MRATRTSLLGRSLSVFLELLRPSLFLTALTVVLHGIHWRGLEWLDGPFLAQVQNVAAGKGESPLLNPRTEVLTIEITAELFEGDLRRSTPLDRNFLADLLNQVSEAKPKAIVVDLDLSPPFRQLASDRVGQNALDEMLGKIAEEIPVILMVPIADSEVGKTARARWMSKMCAISKRLEEKKKGPGISYGLARSVTQEGVALRFPKRRGCNEGAPGCGKEALYPTLPVVACSAVEASSDGKTKSGCPRDSTTPVHQLLCTVPNRIDDIYQESISEFETINFATAPFLAYPLRSASIDAIKEYIKGKVVFIGGGEYGQADRVATPLTDSESGKWPGVEAHAAAYASLTTVRGSLTDDKIVSAGVDLTAGLIYGSILDALMRREKHGKTSKRPPFLWNTTRLVAPLIAAWGVFMAVAMLSVYLVLNEVWVNPLIVLVGLLIHSYHEALHGAVLGRKYHEPAALDVRNILWQFVLPPYLVGPVRSTATVVDRYFFYVAKVVIYWGIVIWAVYCLWNSN